MKIAAEQLAQHLERGVRPLYVLTGDEPLALMECLDAIRAAARRHGYNERLVLRAERGFDWRQLKASSQSLSLFSSRRLIELHIPSGKPGNEGSSALRDYATHPPPDTLTVVVLPHIDKRDRSDWYPALEAAGVVVPILTPTPDHLPAWLRHRLAAQGLQTDTETLEFLAHQVEGNLLAAHQEIQKLGLLYPQGRLTLEQVRDAVLNVSRYDPFQLGDAMLAGDATRAAHVLEGLKSEGVEPVALVGVLAWLLRGALKVKSAQARGMDLMSAFGQAKIWGDRQQLMRHALGRLSLKKLQAALLKMAEIDKINKGVTQGEPWLEISRLCLGLARTGPSRSP
ncbi:MAG: DNA polymerase III subunit delta [Methylophilaceae bacterium]|nr:DNA polymerase III subunit delta [Methylophilaceae bacterium]